MNQEGMQVSKYNYFNTTYHPSTHPPTRPPTTLNVITQTRTSELTKNDDEIPKKCACVYAYMNIYFNTWDL